MSYIAANLYYGVLLDESQDANLIAEDSALSECTWGWEGEGETSVFAKASHIQAANCSGEKIKLKEVQGAWVEDLHAYCKRNNIDTNRIGWYLAPFLG